MILIHQVIALISILCAVHAHANDICVDEKREKSLSSPTVAIIGCGPSGISFLHAINLRRKKMEEERDFDGLLKLPIATCFERSSGPGGVWKAQRAHSHSLNETLSTASGSTNMYEALWTNGAKELIEFPDYTFMDHFNRSLPAFLPRKLVLDYMLARVLRDEPDFFSHARFNTEVDFVQFDESTEKFEITAHDVISHKKSTLHFDKCIWGAGLNGKKIVPRSIETILQKSKYEGTIMHSSAAGNYLSDVKGKRILMIGDAYSAEDLTLQALKLGVEAVYILSRSGLGICGELKSWPKGEVRVLYDMVLTDVTEGGRGLRFSEAKYDIYDDEVGYEPRAIPNGAITDIADISAVIYCTGYLMNTSMLDAPLKDAFTVYNEEGYELESHLKASDMPTSWVMSPNSLTESIGTIEPNNEIDSGAASIYPGLYRGMLISNPSMMYMLDGSAGFPLLELDVQAWLLLAHLTGDLNMPSTHEMVQWNTQKLMTYYMQQPYWRFLMDTNYRTAWWGEIDDDDDRINELSLDWARLVTRDFAQNLKDASYPLDIGTAEDLNEAGDLIVNMLTNNHRWSITEDESGWKTFRDGDPTCFVSLNTGTTAAPFEQHWIDIDEKDLKLTKK